MHFEKQSKPGVLRTIKNTGNDARAGKKPPALATVSGVLSTKIQLIKYASEYLGFALVTTKSFQVLPNKGNREPVVCEPETGCFGNSVGLKNDGMETAFRELAELRKRTDLKALLNVSLSASSPEDFITLIKKFEPVADCVELNFSCPHAAAGFGASIGCDKSIAADYVLKIKEALPACTVPIFVKLTPNVENIGEIAAAVIKAGADGISAVNTVGPKVHIDPLSGKPILQNKLGGKGGMSGAWIFERALECIREIRHSVGPDVPIIGMGGITSGTQAASMLRAGADIIGIGSACGMLEQDDLKPFFEALASDTLTCINGAACDTASGFLRKKRALVYVPKKITAREKAGEDVVVLTLDGECEFEAGRFVFLWIPGVGEKPFSLAEGSPVRLIIKRRGEFTQALFDLREGDTVYMRGPYGRAVQIPKTENALLAAGGTGIAVLPALAKKLTAQNTAVSVYTGSSEKEGREPNTVEKMLMALGPYKKVCDNGVQARVLQVLKEDLKNGNIGLSVKNKGSADSLVCYLVGPTLFMRAASDILKAGGVQKEQIFFSLEKNTMCGIGMCGECACGDILTCKQGTFVRLDILDKIEE